MSYFMTEEQELIRNVAREFAQEEVEPLANEIDKTEECPVGLIKRAAELNLFGLSIPEEYGGTGSDFVTECLVLEEIAKASPALAGLFSVQIGLTPTVLLTIGTDEQKRRYLPDSASGKRLISWAMTEPSGAGNFMNHQTRLTPHGDGYLLNGLKIFCTQGTGEVYLVMTKTTAPDGKEGYGCVIVEKGMKGFEVGNYEDKLGWRGTNTGTVSFKDVYVPKENIVGDLLTGAILPGNNPYNWLGAVGHAATCLGLAEGAFDKTLAYVKQRVLYGVPMQHLQPMSYWLAEASAKIEACRGMVYNAARLHDEGNNIATMSSLTKAFVSETSFQVANTCLQMWGCHGIANATGINRYMRDARTKCVAEGATEMLYSQVAMGLFA